MHFAGTLFFTPQTGTAAQLHPAHRRVSTVLTAVKVRYFAAAQRARYRYVERVINLAIQDDRTHVLADRVAPSSICPNVPTGFGDVVVPKVTKGRRPFCGIVRVCDTNLKIIRGQSRGRKSLAPSEIDRNIM